MYFNGSVLTQLHCGGGLTASGVVQGSVMLLGGVDVLVTQNIGYKVNIPCFLVQGGTVGTAELVRGDFLGGGNLAGVFLDQVFDGLDANPFALGRVEESVLVAFYRDDIFAHFQVVFQGFFYFRAEIYNHFISAFSGNLDSVIFEIYILNVKTDTFRNTNTCSQQESDESEVAVLGFS